MKRGGPAGGRRTGDAAPQSVGPSSSSTSTSTSAPALVPRPPSLSGSSPPTAADAAGAPSPCPPSAGAAPADTVVRVVRRFRVIFNAVRTHFRRVEKLAGVGGAHLWALGIVARRPGLGIGELAAALDVHPSTASNLVKSLVGHGLLRTVKAGADRRAVQIHLLAAGADVLARAPGPFAGVLPEALAALDAATLARLDADLTRLIGALGADARGAAIPLAEMLALARDRAVPEAAPSPDASPVAVDR